MPGNTPSVTAAEADRAPAPVATGLATAATPGAAGVHCADDGREIDLFAAAAALHDLGLASVMVEGGARVLAGFIRQHGAAAARSGSAQGAVGTGAGVATAPSSDSGAAGPARAAGLVGQVIVTLAPLLLCGGVRIDGAGGGGLGGAGGAFPFPMRLEDGGRWHVVGGDVVLEGAPAV